MTQDSIPRQMRNTTVHNGVDKSPRQSPRQRKVELSNGVSCHGNNGYHGGELKHEQWDHNRSYEDVTIFDDSYTSRVNGESSETRGCMISPKTDTVYTNRSNGNKFNITDAVPSATNVNCISTNGNASELLDIKNNQSELCLVQLVRESLCDPKPSLSSLLLWNGRGLQLFEKITQLPDYYISGLEKQILEQHCEDIARKIQPGSMIIDLGCG